MSRPLLRWAGSKRQLLAAIRSFVPQDFSKYVEPFCGSAALFFDLKPASAVLGDTNLELINFYNCIKQEPRSVYEIYDKIPVEKSVYLDIRRELYLCPSAVTRSAYFYYLNRNCFNGLFRTNRDGKFNVPFSESRTGRKIGEDAFLELADALKTASFVAGDFEAVVRGELGSDTFFFLDPPYSVARRRPFTEYGKNVFGRDDLQRLLSVLEAIDDSGAKFAITYEAELKDLFQLRPHWLQREVTVRRNISGFATGRRTATEIVTLNYQP